MEKYNVLFTYGMTYTEKISIRFNVIFDIYYKLNETYNFS